VEDSKTEKGERVLAIPPGLAASFDLYRASTPYNEDEDFVFHPELGNRLNGDHFREAMHEALEKAGIREVFRPFHDCG
jgi:integrase